MVWERRMMIQSRTVVSQPSPPPRAHVSLSPLPIAPQPLCSPFSPPPAKCARRFLGFERIDRSGRWVLRDFIIVLITSFSRDRQRAKRTIGVGNSELRGGGVIYTKEEKEGKREGEKEREKKPNKKGVDRIRQGKETE